MAKEENNLPSELTKIVTDFDENLKNVENGFDKLFETSILEIKERVVIFSLFIKYRSLNGK